MASWIVVAQSAAPFAAAFADMAERMTGYVALLRGINVGGKNVIRMVELKACFEKHGFEQVSTYIQSGNVLFSSAASDRDKLTLQIEELLAASFAYRASVVLRTLKQMRGIVKRAPDGFGAEPARHRYDVLFLKNPLTPSAAVQSVPTEDGVDQVFAGSGVLYYSRLISKAAQSRLAKLASMPIYRSMTMRNWNTTTKLLQLMEERLR